MYLLILLWACLVVMNALKLISIPWLVIALPLMLVAVVSSLVIVLTAIIAAKVISSVKGK